MANDNWQDREGLRWATRDQIRVARRFRHHIRTASNPRGRIERGYCYWHPDRTGEAHHPDYTQPFLIVWACSICHREIDHGSKRIPKLALRDYSSLVFQKPSLQREQRPLSDDVPF